jgi:enoyl-[acyl-carrier protein] reductase / trans-2-enoyl-CoA reductase (NAD+)
MIIQPKVRGFICTSAHPNGCHKNVEQQINYIKKQGAIEDAPCNVLVIGASTGYGLASRITATFAGGAKTIGVFFEKPAAGKRTASAGWYNTAAFESLAHDAGYYAKSINGDAFSNEIKQQTVDLIRSDLGKVDLIIYSLASPRRVHPVDHKTYSSVLKPLAEPYSNKTVDPIRGEIKDISIEPAIATEVEDTVMVMGGEDWQMWITLLEKENLLTENFKTVAYSYIGPELTHPIYKEGTIGKAKDHLQKTADDMNAKYSGQALISVNKALVTQASSAIPVVPLYMSILFKLMKQAGTHEGCIEQMYRLFCLLYSSDQKLDEHGRIRIDDLEMKPEIQQQIETLWQQVSTENLTSLTDIEGYRNDFYNLFGFNVADVDYETEVDPNVPIRSIDEG